jgi:3-methyladenine DNA glycosylase AlkD
MTARKAEIRLLALADEAAAEAMCRFFKTGPGQYAEGDRFLGIKTGPLRQVAREFQSLPLDETAKLLCSVYHEARMLALLILVRTFEKGGEPVRQAIHAQYLANTHRVNNWDLVDVSAATIVGGFLADRDRALLTRLAASASLWERRIAIVATHHFIRHGEFTDTLQIAALLMGDREDLIHKAVGWMLREVGKRDQEALEGFLVTHCRQMPRTMLRYATERFEETLRRRYLRGEV